MKRIAPCLFVVLLSLGCAKPLTQIKTFASATTLLSRNAEDAYRTFDEAVIKQRIYDTAFIGTTDVDPAMFTGLFAKSNRLEVRVAVFQKLAAYASALQQLAEADLSSEIDASSKHLYSSLVGLKGTLEKAGQKIDFKDSDVAIVATAVDAMGRIWVERKRRAAIKRTVILADPAVQKAAELLKGELGGLAPDIFMNANDATSILIKAYQKERAGLSVPERVERIEAVREQHLIASNSKGMFERLGSAGDRIATAHAKIKENMVKKHYTAKYWPEELSALVEDANAIKDFYGNLSTKK